MGIFLAILLFVGFVILLISMSKDVNTSNPQSSTTPSSSSSSPALKSSSNQAVKADWNTSIFREDALRRGNGLYRQGINIYQVSPETASQYFRDAFNSIQSLATRYSNNPIFYLNMVECAMGFDYDVAIISGNKFFELVEYGNFTIEQMATIYDVSRKMYKLLIAQGQFEAAKRFAGETIYVANEVLKQTYNAGLERERDIAAYFYGNLSEGNHNVKRNITHGLDSPEAWCKFDIINEPEMLRKIQGWVREAVN